TTRASGGGDTPSGREARLGARVWLSATPTVPWPHAVHLDLEREAEEDPYDHDHPQHGDALEGLIDNDRPDDVGDDQHLEAEQDAPTQLATERLVRARPLRRAEHAR